MGHKKSIGKPEDLRFRLDSLQGYISSVERMLDQLGIDLEMASLTRTSDDTLAEILGRVKDAVARAWTAHPRTDLFEKDLAEARAALNQVYEKWEDTPAVEQAYLERGHRRCLADEGLFEYQLSRGYLDIINRLDNLAVEVNQIGLAGKLIGLISELRQLLDFSLKPARLLRELWQTTLDGGTQTKHKFKGPDQKRGRPADPEVEARSKRMCEAWMTGEYRTHADLAKAFKVSKDTATKAISSFNRKNRRPGTS